MWFSLPTVVIRQSACFTCPLRCEHCMLGNVLWLFIWNQSYLLLFNLCLSSIFSLHPSVFIFSSSRCQNSQKHHVGMKAARQQQHSNTATWQHAGSFEVASKQTTISQGWTKWAATQHKLDREKCKANGSNINYMESTEKRRVTYWIRITTSSESICAKKRQICNNRKQQQRILFNSNFSNKQQEQRCSRKELQQWEQL